MAGATGGHCAAIGCQRGMSCAKEEKGVWWSSTPLPAFSHTHTHRDRAKEAPAGSPATSRRRPIVPHLGCCLNLSQREREAAKAGSRGSRLGRPRPRWRSPPAQSFSPDAGNGDSEHRQRRNEAAPGQQRDGESEPHQTIQIEP